MEYNNKIYIYNKLKESTMTKDTCSNCGTAKTSTFWTFEDDTMLCDKCHTHYGKQWQKEIDKKKHKGKHPLKILLIVLGSIFGAIILLGIILGVLSYFGVISPSNSTTDTTKIQGINTGTQNPQPTEYCGDGYCNNGETCSSCSSDCGRCAYCGDTSCNNGETCTSCSSDCGKCKKDIQDIMKKSIVWVKYDVNGRNADGSYFSTGGSGSGVITSNKDGELQIYTNRHVVDCRYNDMNCYQRISEKVSVRTQDGKIYNVNRVSFSKSDIDLALLNVKTSSASEYPFAYYTDKYEIGDDVTAVGYPAYAPNVVEFSVSEGTITNIKDVLSQSTGTSFKTIESDAYTYFGSSGGGLFDAEGNLVGINTWGTNQNHIAIVFDSINSEQFIYCSDDAYYFDGKCYTYCDETQIMGDDNRCYDICDNFYCLTKQSPANDPRCQDAGYILGSDGYCHKPCGSGYCGDSTAICYKARCVTCNTVNSYLYEDGNCYSS